MIRLRAIRTSAWGPALLGVMLLCIAQGCQTVEQPPAPAPASSTAAAPQESVPPVATAPPESVSPSPSLTPPPVRVERSPSLVRPGGPAPVRVGLLLPLSGPQAEIGQAFIDAAMLALFEIADDRLLLLPRDTRGTAEGAKAAAETALQEGAQLLLGPVFAASVRAAAEPARLRSVPLVAFSTDRSVSGDGVYLMGFVPGQQVERVVEFAMAQGIQRFAALAPESPYGVAVIQAMQDVVSRRGGLLSDIEYYAPDGEQAAESVKRLARYGARKQALRARVGALRGRTDAASQRELRALSVRDTLGDLPFDAVLLPEGGRTLTAVAPLLPYYDIDPKAVRFLGTGLWDDPMTSREPALHGGWFAAPAPEARSAFFARYQESFGRRPPRLASIAYDATALAAVLARSPDGPSFSEQALQNPSGFAGIDGIFRFGPDGIAERGLAILEVQSDGLRVIREAPQTFQALTN